MSLWIVVIGNAVMLPVVILSVFMQCVVMPRSVFMTNVIILPVVILSVFKTECPCAECHYAE